MPQSGAPPGSAYTAGEASQELERLRERVEALEQTNQDLQLMLETTAEHSDELTATLEEEREDLAAMLEMTTEHADVVEDELHQRAEEVVRKSERQLRLLVEATPTPVFISRLSDDKLVYANTMMERLFRMPGGELLERTTVDFFEVPSVCSQLLDQVNEEGSVDRHEACLTRPDSSLVWVEISLRLLEFDDEPSVLYGLHDITHLRAMNQASSRFVPKEYLGFLQKESITDISLGDHVTGEMTVMFSDLRGFTSVSETMTPEENFAFINSYLSRVSPIVRQNRGFIIKYLGDGIHAIFPGDADNGLRAGIEKLEEVNAYNEDRIARDRLPIAIGVGVNTGYMMVGMVGESDRMQGDAFSDDVNLTARIEGLTKFYGTSLIISQSTYSRLADPGAYHIRFLDTVQVVGRKQALKLYEVFDADPPQMRALKQETQSIYEEALGLYYEKRFEEAQSKLFDVLQRNPRDKPAWHHLVNATRLVDSGAPDGWTGVTVMDAK